jgi:beta-N-acetylhexosaminidase
VLDAPVELLARRELVPFAAVVAAGVDAVMTSHVVVRALDGEPATLSASVLGGLLRGELGFDGVIVTDALDMRGASGNRTIGEAAVLSLLAGADLLCLGARQDEELLDAVVGAIADAGPDAEAALATAAARIAAFHGRAVTAGLVGVQDGGIGRVAAARAIRVAGAPLPSLRGARVVELRPTPGMAAGDVPWSVAAVLVDRDPTIAPIRLGAGDTTDDALVAAAGHPLVVVVRDAHRHAWQGELLSHLLGDRPDAVVVDLGWPPPGRPPAATVVTTYGASRASAEAVADLLLREDSLCG